MSSILIADPHPLTRKALRLEAAGQRGLGETGDGRELSELAREWSFLVAEVAGSRAPSPQPSPASGRGSCPCREKNWLQPEITEAAG